MAGVGSVVPLGRSTAAKTATVDTLTLRKIAWLDSAKVVQRKTFLADSNLLQMTNSAEVEGRFYKKESLDPVDSAAIAADAVIASKVAAAQLGPFHFAAQDARTNLVSNAHFAIATRG